MAIAIAIIFAIDITLIVADINDMDVTSICNIEMAQLWKHTNTSTRLPTYPAQPSRHLREENVQQWLSPPVIASMRKHWYAVELIHAMFLSAVQQVECNTLQINWQQGIVKGWGWVEGSRF